MTFSDFSITVSENYFNPKWKKVQSLFTFLQLPMPNRMSIQLISLLNQRLRIPAFGRHVVGIQKNHLSHGLVSFNRLE